MPSDSVSSTGARAPYHINLAERLSDAEQDTIASLLSLLPSDCIEEVTVSDYEMKETDVEGSSVLILKKMVDGRGLACPMPLLKTKVALRDIASGESLYVVATDPNSKADITAFCQQTKQTDTANTLLLVVNQATADLYVNPASAKFFDTIFHFIITKTDSN